MEGESQARGRPAVTGEPAGEVTTPKGTVLLTLLYGLTVMALWGYMYVSMVLRSGGSPLGG